MTDRLTDTNVGNIEYISKQGAVDAVPKERIVEYMDEFGAGYNSCRNDILRSIESIEPIDVAPVVHGKWIDHDGNKVQLNEHGETCGTCFCNQCGEWLVASDEYAVKGYFCPNCGAKMDKE